MIEDGICDRWIANLHIVLLAPGFRLGQHHLSLCTITCRLPKRMLVAAGKRIEKTPLGELHGAPFEIADLSSISIWSTG